MGHDSALLDEGKIETTENERRYRKHDIGDREPSDKFKCWEAAGGIVTTLRSNGFNYAVNTIMYTPNRPASFISPVAQMLS